jgi:hypothetical protein
MRSNDIRAATKFGRRSDVLECFYAARGRCSKSSVEIYLYRGFGTELREGPNRFLRPIGAVQFRVATEKSLGPSWIVAHRQKPSSLGLMLLDKQ